MAAQAVAEFQDRFIVGEEVSARDGDVQRPCIVLSITSVDNTGGTSAHPLWHSYYECQGWC